MWHQTPRWAQMVSNSPKSQSSFHIQLELVDMIPWKRKCQRTPVFLPGESHGGAWCTTVHGVAESQTQLSD